MEQYYQADSFRFKIKKISMGEYPPGGPKGIFAEIALVIDGEELFSRDFDMCLTLNAFRKGIRVLVKAGRHKDMYFFCTCGFSGPIGIWWDMVLKNGTILVKMEGRAHTPIGKHLYLIEKREFLEGFLFLCDDIIEFMQRNNYRVDMGTSTWGHEDVREVREELESYLDS